MAQRVTIERASNGYIIHDDVDDEVDTFLVADDDPVRATYDMLRHVHECIGHIGSEWDRERIRIIIEPGVNWEPAADD